MTVDKDELLGKLKELLKDEVSTISYDTWIAPLGIDSINDDNIVFTATSDFQKDFIENKFNSLIFNTLRYITNREWTFSVIDISSKESSDASIITNKNSNVSDTELENNHQTLNPKYTFETFVVGNNNRFAHAAALAVGKEPGKSYNPLFLYGGVGLGKTHLMQAIGNRILEDNPKSNVLYVTSEKFTNQLINAIKDSKTEIFRNKYRNIDVLLIDDIQFIAGKDRIQEEFFHTFNTLRENGKQIILSSDKPPRDIEFLEDRLKSRFEWGLLADISCPDYETRLAILRKKAQDENIVIDDSILSDIATKIDSNIRELEGVFNKIVARASLTHSPITIELAENIINEFRIESCKYCVGKVPYHYMEPDGYFEIEQGSERVAVTKDYYFNNEIIVGHTDWDCVLSDWYKKYEKDFMKSFLKSLKKDFYSENFKVVDVDDRLGKFTIELI